MLEYLIPIRSKGELQSLKLQKTIHISRNELNLDYKKPILLRNLRNRFQIAKGVILLISSRRVLWLPMESMSRSKTLLNSKLPQYHKYMFIFQSPH